MNENQTFVIRTVCQSSVGEIDRQDINKTGVVVVTLFAWQKVCNKTNCHRFPEINLVSFTYDESNRGILIGFRGIDCQMLPRHFTRLSKKYSSYNDFKTS